MSGVQMPKLKSYTLYNPELIHVLRSPPSSIHTRKKERITDSDVLYMIRNDDTRINEGVSYLARGTNPMVDVSYNNMGGASRTNSMPNVQASNPYKIKVFRPPLQRQEDLLPLSRMRHPETMAITNPGIRNGMAIHDLSNQFDKAQVFSSVDKTNNMYQSIRPTATYNIAVPMEVFTGGNINHNKQYYNVTSAVNSDYNFVDAWNNLDPNIIKADVRADILKLSAGTNVFANEDVERSYNIDKDNYIKDNIILKNISPNFSIQIYNPETQKSVDVNANLKDKLNIAVQSSMGNPISLVREDGQNIKLKDYVYKIVNTNVGVDKLVLVVPSFDYELDRNIPIYAVSTNTSGYTSNDRMESLDPITGEKISTSVGTAISNNRGRTEAIHDTEHNIQLRGMATTGYQLDNIGNVPSVTRNKNTASLNNDKSTDIKRYATSQVGDRYEWY